MDHSTGLEEYSIKKDGKVMRLGYTTGSCAAAASKAAAFMLLSGNIKEEVSLMTPKGILIHLLIEDIDMAADRVSCAVRKNAGDDPDVTDGILVYSCVSLKEEPEIEIDGAKGVGRVTKPGLNQPVGAAAINSVPRSMIKKELEDVKEELGYKGGFKVLISIPEGAAIAEKTFNPRLGIEGGISVLGTSGIVVPMSDAAVIESIRAEMSMLKEAGSEYIVLTPGNYGEDFCRQNLNVDLTYSMKCSNFIGDVLEIADNLELKGLLFVAHIGKFIKLSGGIMNTHSHNADCRAELMAAAAIKAGADIKCAKKILGTFSTEEALDILKEHGIMETAMHNVMDRIQFYLKNQKKTGLEIGTVIYSNVYGLLARSDNADDIIEKINGQGTAGGDRRRTGC